jgi:transposase-like protein
MTTSPQKRAQIVAALKDNPNASAVAREIGGVSCQTVWRFAKEARLELTAGNAHLSPQKRAQIIRALEANPNASAVARRVGGVSNVAVWKIAKRKGIELTLRKAAKGTPRPRLPHAKPNAPAP